MAKDERRDKRIPIGLKVRFKSATIAEFIEQYSRDLSRGGIFIRADSPMPIGTLIKFDICLKDEKSLIQGVGRVVWRRDENVSDDAPAGMGIKFIKLDEASRTNLDIIMNEAQVGEGKPPGEAPLIVETRGEEGAGGEAGPIEPVRPQGVPKGAKRTIIGMGPSSPHVSGAPESPSSPAEAEKSGREAAPVGEAAGAEASLRGGDFLADISNAIDNALGSSESSPPVAATPAKEPEAAVAPGEAGAAPAEAKAPEAQPAEPVKEPADAAAAVPEKAPSEPVKIEAKEAPKGAERRDEAPAKGKHVDSAAVRIGADTRTRRGVPPIVWLLLLAGAAGAIYYFGFYAPGQEQGEEPVGRDVTPEPPKPKPEPPKPEPPKPEPPKPTGGIEEDPYG